MFNRLKNDIIEKMKVNGKINIAIDYLPIQMDGEIRPENISETDTYLRVFCSNLTGDCDFNLYINKDADLKFNEETDSYIINDNLFTFLLTFGE